MTPLQGFICAAIFVLFALAFLPLYGNLERETKETRINRLGALVLALVFGGLCSMITAEMIHPSPRVEHHPCVVRSIYPPAIDCP